MKTFYNKSYLFENMSKAVNKLSQMCWTVALLSSPWTLTLLSLWKIMKSQLYNKILPIGLIAMVDKTPHKWAACAKMILIFLQITKLTAGNLHKGEDRGVSNEDTIWCSKLYIHSSFTKIPRKLDIYMIHHALFKKTWKIFNLVI